MDFKGLARRAVNRGVRGGVGFVSRKLADPRTRQAIGDVIGGKEPATVLREYRDSGRAERTERARREREQAPRERKKKGTDPRSEYAPATKAGRQRPKQSFPRRPSGGYPGDYTGLIRPIYTPDLDGEADPGEIVWAWVPYEEDHSKGKDRPVLIIGREGRWLLGLMLTSKDNIPGSVGEVHVTEHARYINIGTGDWDVEHRPSEIRLDRIVRIEDGAVRREGAIMPMGLFSRVVDEVRNA